MALRQKYDMMKAKLIRQWVTRSQYAELGTGKQLESCYDSPRLVVMKAELWL